MTLTDQVEAHFRVSKKCAEFLRKIQSNFVNEEFELSLGVTSGQSVSEALETARVHHRTTSQAGIQSFGFVELITSLEKMLPQEMIGVGILASQSWAGRVLFKLSAPRDFIGLIVVRRRDGPRMKTPPGWDGTREMLERYNGEH